MEIQSKFSPLEITSHISQLDKITYRILTEVNHFYEYISNPCIMYIPLKYTYPKYAKLNLSWNLKTESMTKTWYQNHGLHRKYTFNTLRPRQDGRHFPDDIFKCIFLNEDVWIPIKISLKFVPKGPINNIPALVQIMAWRRPGDKPLSEPMMVVLPMHICVTRPEWVNNCLEIFKERFKNLNNII